ncbi:MAG: hypothetical protein FJ083_17010 [Cyanobacteria bacterium K_Offshore_surface_m2_239]|nr:hypothetical protein [Cyanobacteria bacterium K_Offshore_surface_m2_239]
MSEDIKLGVPYEFQLNSETSQGDRMCFTSTISMAAAFLRPDLFKAGNGQRDDQWLRVVNRFGDTTSSTAQIAALRSRGINAQFRIDGSVSKILATLEKGLPAAVGWLHNGPVEAPRGGGHWSLVVGTPKIRGLGLLFHDPNGEADLVNGGYVSNGPTAGRFVRYSVKNWAPRWEVEGPGTGWWVDFGV